MDTANKDTTYTTELFVDFIKNGTDRENKSSHKPSTKNPQNVSVSDIRKPVSIIAYIPFLWILGLLIYPLDEEVQFHVNQGILLNIFFVVISMLVSILTDLLLMISPVMLFLTTLMYIILGILTLVFITIGITNVYFNKSKSLPIIGKAYIFVE